MTSIHKAWDNMEIGPVTKWYIVAALTVNTIINLLWLFGVGVK